MLRYALLTVNRSYLPLAKKVQPEAKKPTTIITTSISTLLSTPMKIFRCFPCHGGPNLFRSAPRRGLPHSGREMPEFAGRRAQSLIRVASTGKDIPRYL